MTNNFDAQLLSILNRHVGASSSISWEDLTWAILGDDGMLDYHAVKVQVRETIERLRDSGEIICSNQRGYFRAASESEFNDFLAEYRGPALKRLHTASQMDAGRSRYFAKQLTLEGEKS